MARSAPVKPLSAGPRVGRRASRRPALGRAGVRGARVALVASGLSVAAGLFGLVGLVGLGGLVGCGSDAGVGGAGRFVEVPTGAPIRHLVVEGTPYEMGVHQGRLLREAIRARVARPIAAVAADVLPGYAGPMRDLLPVGAQDELRGIAAGAGVREDDLFAREIERDVLRWHEPTAGLTTAAFASAPGETPCLAVAYGTLAPALGGRARPAPAAAAGPATAADLVFVERHPAGGTKTLVLAAPGSVGGFAGVSGRGVVVACAEDGSREPEQRSMRGPPFPVGVRFALERAGDAEAALAALPKMLGHRVLVADAGNARVDVLVALAGEEPVRFPATAWVLRPASGADLAQNAEAQDRKLASYTARPGCADALDLAEAGIAPAAGDDAALRFHGGGVEVAGDLGATFGYGWAR